MGISDAVDKAKEIVENYQKIKRIDIEKPRWDQTTFSGRLKHFWAVTKPINLFASDKKLDYAKDIVTRYRKGETIPNLSEDELWKQKQLYDSAFHPETGDKTFFVGRMSAQAPINMMITGGMITFYKTLPALLFWQWLNQSFNAVVNFCNRSGAGEVSTADMASSYTQATAGAMSCALLLNKLASRAPPALGRFVPFMAVCASNAINIPLVRIKEITEGMKIMDSKGENLGYSKTTGKIAISQVVLSRSLMAAPAMISLPIIMGKLEKSGFLKKYPAFPLPFQVLACGAILTFATPLGCAIYPQVPSIPVSYIEPELQEKIKKMSKPVTEVYYNKGL